MDNDDLMTFTPTKENRIGIAVVGVIAGLSYGVFTYVVARMVQAKTLEGVSDAIFLHNQGIGTPSD